MGDDQERLPREVRPLVFATCELLLDLIHIWRSASGDIDLEALVILAVVNEATMRKLLIGPGAPLHLIDHPTPPDGARGSISRHAIADRLDLPRETTRRRVNQLIAAGVLVETAEGEVRAPQRLMTPAAQQAARDSLLAVRRFDKRLRALDCEGV